MANSAPPIGYLLKNAQAALHLRMEEALRPLGLTVSHYACLHILAAQPGISAAELARSTFVTRQSMNTLLQGLLERHLVARPARAAAGRALPTTLTPAGAEVLARAEVLVDEVESRMLSRLSADARRDLGLALTDCIGSLA
jgi:DNA-binding MarR family transcriptional regulator